jgi:hypothetical protein
MERLPAFRGHEGNPSETGGSRLKFHGQDVQIVETVKTPGPIEGGLRNGNLVDRGWDRLRIRHSESKDAPGSLPKGKEVDRADRGKGEQGKQAGQERRKQPKRGVP